MEKANDIASKTTRSLKHWAIQHSNHGSRHYGVRCRHHLCQFSLARLGDVTGMGSIIGGRPFLKVRFS
jgi:hypothetical protein